MMYIIVTEPRDPLSVPSLEQRPGERENPTAVSFIQQGEPEQWGWMNELILSEAGTLAPSSCRL